jgi:S1-C subfamily serine protease
MCTPVYLPQKQPDNTTIILKKASDVVVFIISNRFDFSLQNFSEFSNGVLITDNGYIITVAHGLFKSPPIVYFKNGVYHSKIVHADQKFDFALLKIDVPERLPYVRFATDVKIHENVYLIGKRKRQREIFMSKGIISACNLNMSSREISWLKTDIRQKKQVDYAIQNGILHSADFFVGLSGCPLLNEYGDLLAINTGIVEGNSRRMSLAQELICFLPVINSITNSSFPVDYSHLCNLNVDLNDPFLRIGWILDGLAQYCYIQGRDSMVVRELRNKTESEAMIKL